MSQVIAELEREISQYRAELQTARNALVEIALWAEANGHQKPRDIANNAIDEIG